VEIVPSELKASLRSRFSLNETIWRRSPYILDTPLRRVEIITNGVKPSRLEDVRTTLQSNSPPSQAHGQELDTLKALRASMESIKQVVQGIHDDLIVSQENMVEFTRSPSLALHAYKIELQEKWTGVVDQVEQQNKRR
jgi:hypothetical protein